MLQVQIQKQGRGPGSGQSRVVTSFTVARNVDRSAYSRLHASSAGRRLRLPRVQIYASLGTHASNGY
jgi:hypothetical protein